MREKLIVFNPQTLAEKLKVYRVLLKKFVNSRVNSPAAKLPDIYCFVSRF